MPIPMKLDYLVWRLTDAGSVSDVLRRVSGLRLGAMQAWLAWPRVLEHKWLLSERLGRDVGLRVAAVDYFDNFAR